MSLDAEQRRRTAEELRANLALAGLAGLADERARIGSGLSEQRWHAALAVDGARPEDVWLVRDHLEHLVRTAGHEPVPYTVLTEGMRSAAAGWFPLR